jgi:hypothetical protein
MTSPVVTFFAEQSLPLAEARREQLADDTDLEWRLEDAREVGRDRNYRDLVNARLPQRAPREAIATGAETIIGAHSVTSRRSSREVWSSPAS